MVGTGVRVRAPSAQHEGLVGVDAVVQHQRALGLIDEPGLGIDLTGLEYGRVGGSGTVGESLTLQHVEQTVRRASGVRESWACLNLSRRAVAAKTSCRGLRSQPPSTNLRDRREPVHAVHGTAAATRSAAIRSHADKPSLRRQREHS